VIGILVDGVGQVTGIPRATAQRWAVPPKRYAEGDDG
jgi:hypothetical protein